MQVKINKKHTPVKSVTLFSKVVKGLINIYPVYSTTRLRNMTILIMKMTVTMKNMLIAVAFVKLFFDPMTKQMTTNLTIFDVKKYIVCFHNEFE